MIIETVFTDEGDPAGLTLEKPAKEDFSLVQVEDGFYHDLFRAYRRDPKALAAIVKIMGKPEVTSIKLVAEQDVIEYSAEFEKNGRSN